ncbi:FAD-dependent oxidoreductase [Phreatobacter stygius]|uniref:FAD-dependent oxidoreductase n=1 Tax=Phreatobacter stygius TaxID=1940610 RepID=A0A4D7B6E4_9HYPH|nr:FAD-dependent oxidoreductase [Phreatobacter stygius]QCI65948.1 FAD-dependent oxidoreductase [Phreatobacter stygius]
MIGKLDGLQDGASYDVVVIGSGGAGMAAAVFAAIEDKRVLLVERTEYLGGTTALSAATTWAPNSHHAKGSGDSFEKADRFLTNVVGNHSRLDMRRAFLRSAPKAIAVLEAGSDVRFRPYALHPDYVQEVEGATLTGRALEPLPFDGRQLGEVLALVRPPIPEFTIFGGMMVDRTDIGHLLKLKQSVASFRHAAKMLGRHALDRLSRPRGTRLVMGNALIGRMLLTLRQRQVDIVLQTSVTELIRDGHTVTGVVLASQGAARRITATSAVVMASGGFNRHKTRRAEMLHRPTPAYSPGAPGHTGELQDLALGLGARFGEGSLDNAFWAPVSVRKRADGSTAVFPHFVMDRSKPGTVAVNSLGRRFVNETVSYHLFSRAMFETHPQAPCIPAFLITDAEGLRKYGLGMVRPGGRRLKPYLADGYLTEAPSVAELAEKLGIDDQALEQTIAAMNGYAATGVDTAFGRGTTAYHRVNGDAGQQPNPTLGPIATAPFYAVKLYPGDIGAANGLVTDEQAQVLDRDNQPIRHLYACGNDMQSIMGGTYPGPGITIGPAITFAYRAIRHALHGETN